MVKFPAIFHFPSMVLVILFSLSLFLSLSKSSRKAQMVWLFPFFPLLSFQAQVAKNVICLLIINVWGKMTGMPPLLSLKLVIIFLVRFDWGEEGVWGSSKLEGLSG